MRKSRLARLFAVLMALGLVAAACGDDKSSGSGSSGGGGNTASGACDASKPAIKVGGVQQVAFFAGIDDGINARFARENKTCIAGRKLEFIGSKDDGSDAQKNLDLNKAAVEQDKVFAMISTSAVMLPQTTNYLADKKVPFFGWGFMPGFCGKDSWGYGFNGCLSGYAFDVSKAVPGGVPGAKLNSSLVDPIAELVKKPADQISIVYFNSDDDSGKAGDLQYQKLFKNIAQKEFVPTKGVTDFTPYVNIVKNKNPDIVMLSTDFATAIKLKAAIIASGYKGPVYDYTTYVPGLLDAPQGGKETAAALEGGYSVTQFPASEDGKPATKQIADDLVAIGKPAFVTQGASIGYWSADLMIQMLKAIKGDITADNFRKVSDGGFTYKPLDGGIGEIKYPDGHFNPAPCAGVVQVKGGKYVSAVPFKCYKLLDVPK